MHKYTYTKQFSSTRTDIDLSDLNCEIYKFGNNLTSSYEHLPFLEKLEGKKFKFWTLLELVKENNASIEINDWKDHLDPSNVGPTLTVSKKYGPDEYDVAKVKFLLEVPKIEEIFKLYLNSIKSWLEDR